MEPTNVIAWTLLGLFYEIENNDIRMEMAFQEAFKQLQARTLQAKRKRTGTIENIEEGVKTEPGFGPWEAVQDSVSAVKTESLAGGSGTWSWEWRLETYRPKG